MNDGRGTRNENKDHERATEVGRDSTFIICRLSFILLFLSSAFVLAGCTRLEPFNRPTSIVRESSDPYAKALQQALIQQHFNRVRQGAGGYLIGAHDVVEIRVFGYSNMDATVRVSAAGDIRFPPLGNVRAGGLTERQLEAVLEDRLRDGYLQDPHVTVYVKEPHASEVAVVGAVQKPGRYLLIGEKYLVDLLTEVGGMTEKAGSVAYVIRFQDVGTSNPDPSKPPDRPTTVGTRQFPPAGGADEHRIVVDLDGLLLRGEARWNIALMPGDLVNVPEAGSVHLTGKGVKEPGTYPLTRASRTLRQIIDEAGGLKFEANQEMIVFRKETEDKKSVIWVDYKNILKGKRRDFVLQGGDMVVVSQSPVKTPIAVVGRAFGSLIRVGIYGTWQVPVGR